MIYDIKQVDLVLKGIRLLKLLFPFISEDTYFVLLIFIRRSQEDEEDK